MMKNFTNVLPLLLLIVGVIWTGKIIFDELGAPLVYRSSETRECKFVDVGGKEISCSTYTEKELEQLRFGGWR